MRKLARISHDWLVDWLVGFVRLWRLEYKEVVKKYDKNISLSEKDLDAV